MRSSSTAPPHHPARDLVARRDPLRVRAARPSPRSVPRRSTRVHRSGPQNRSGRRTPRRRREATPGSASTARRTHGRRPGLSGGTSTCESSRIRQGAPRSPRPCTVGRSRAQIATGDPAPLVRETGQDGYSRRGLASVADEIEVPRLVPQVLLPGSMTAPRRRARGAGGARPSPPRPGSRSSAPRSIACWAGRATGP